MAALIQTMDTRARAAQRNAAALLSSSVTRLSVGSTARSCPLTLAIQLVPWGYHRARWTLRVSRNAIAAWSRDLLHWAEGCERVGAALPLSSIHEHGPWPPPEWA